MTRLLGILSLFIAVMFGSPAYASTTDCERPIAAASDFAPDAGKLTRKAGYINLWWTSAEAKALTFDEQKARRDEDINEFFSDIESARKTVYAQASCLVVATKKCASTAGNRHSCPMEYAPPANMQFVQSTMKPIDDDFDEWPHFIANGSVGFTNKKTGAGSNTDGFQAIAEYHPDYIATRVQSEMGQVHAIVDPLFKVFLNANAKPS